MFYYKQTVNDEIISLQSASIHIEILPNCFKEITEREFNSLLDEIKNKTNA